MLKGVTIEMWFGMLRKIFSGWILVLLFIACLKSEKHFVTCAISWIEPVTGGQLRQVLRSHRQGQAESLISGALVKLGHAGPFFCSQTSLEIHVLGKIWILRPLDIS